MNKQELMDLVLPENWQGKVDSAVPYAWIIDRIKDRENAYLPEVLNPAFKYAYSYIDHNFGEPINLVDMLVKKISEKKLYLLSEERYMELLDKEDRLNDIQNKNIGAK